MCPVVDALCFVAYNLLVGNVFVFLKGVQEGMKDYFL
jgi:hypothetical protein